MPSVYTEANAAAYDEMTEAAAEGDARPSDSSRESGGGRDTSDKLSVDPAAAANSANTAGFMTSLPTQPVNMYHTSGAFSRRYV
jgi:hypothetical protein